MEENENLAVEEQFIKLDQDVEGEENEGIVQ